MNNSFLRYILIIYSLIVQIILPAQFARSATTSHTHDDLNRLTQTVPDTGVKITTITYSYDPVGNMLSYDVTANFLPGDVDNSQTVDLVDAVLCLQINSGVSPSSPVHQGADIDGDGKISNAELIYILQNIAVLR